MADEVWATIAGFSKYMVSDLGRVKSRETGLFVTQDQTKMFVPLVKLIDDNGQPVVRKVVRLVCDAFIYDPDGYSAVVPINGDKADCRLVNLIRLGDPEKDNKKDRPMKGRVKGPQAPLTVRRSLYEGLAQDPEVAPPVKYRGKKRQGDRVQVVETGKIYISLAQMSRELGLDASTVSKMLRGDSRQKTHRGLTFRYPDDDVAPESMIHADEPARVQRKVLCTTNNVVYESQGDAARALGLHQSAISKILLGKMSQTKGYEFRYVSVTDA